MTYPIHPAIACFPPMTEEEFQGLKQSIAKNGQMASIAYWKGMLVDGRHRLKACEELGIDPMACELLDEEDPVEYAIANNLHRRGISKAQRAGIEAKLMKLKKEAGK